jgi:hypothetical protein
LNREKRGAGTASPEQKKASTLNFESELAKVKVQNPNFKTDDELLSPKKEPITFNI